MPSTITKTYDSFIGGVNTRDRPLKIEETELYSSTNMEPQDNGLGLQGRAGKALSVDITALSSIKSLFTWYKQDATRVTVAFGGTAIYNGESGASRDTGYTNNLKFSCVAWSVKDAAFYTNGTDAVKTDDGTTISTLAGSPPAYEFIELHNDRLWLAEGSLARYCALNDQTSWPAANALNLASPRGGTLMGMKSFGGNLIFLKQGGLWRFEGSPILGGRLLRFSDIGCESKDSVQVTDFGVIFKALDGIYLTDGFTVEKISKSIEPEVGASNTSLVGGWYGQKKQYLASLKDSANTLWVANFLTDTNGQTIIGWHQYTGFKVECFTTREGNAGEAYYGEVDDGRVVQMDTGTQDEGVDFECKFRLRNDQFDTARGAQKSSSKAIRWIDVDMESTKVIKYTIYYNDRPAGSGTVSGSAGTAAPLVWNTGKWNQKTWARDSKVQSRSSSITFRHGHFASVEFSNTGDSTSFKVNSIDLHAVPRGRRMRQIFGLNPED